MEMQENDPLWPKQLLSEVSQKNTCYQGMGLLSFRD